VSVIGLLSKLKGDVDIIVGFAGRFIAPSCMNSTVCKDDLRFVAGRRLFRAHWQKRSAGLLPLPGGHTRTYLKSICSSPAGKRVLHFEQATLPWYQLPGESIVTILYFAPQLGQLNIIGSGRCMTDAKALMKKAPAIRAA
jgi:hypothetical protein